MPYITIDIKPKIKQITLEDLFRGCDVNYFAHKKDTRDTKTYFVDFVNNTIITKTDFFKMYKALADFNNKFETLINTEDKQKLYTSFRIPKSSGGLRKIDAPNDILKTAQRELKSIFEYCFFASYHTSAFAYINGRSSVDAVKRHQANKSRWFLKLDFSKFFPSTTKEFLVRMLSESYPFSEFVKNPYYKAELEKSLSICFLNGGLPQGSPISPMLTNIMMIPIDHVISRMCREHSPHLRYTRYADDIIISSEFSFNWREVQGRIISVLETFGAPFKLNRTKTRYGSSTGRNWNLGLMLNQHNEITVGNKKKKLLKTMIYQFMTDFVNKKPWSIDDVQYLLGKISYFRMVEKERIDEILASYSEKFGIDFMSSAKSLLTT